MNSVLKDDGGCCNTLITHAVACHLAIGTDCMFVLSPCVTFSTISVLGFPISDTLFNVV